jgi:PhnB protein
MTAAHPYLHFNGNAEEAFKFYKSVFGGDFPMIMRYKDAPAEQQMGEEDGEKVLHICLPIGERVILMGGDVPEAHKVTMGTNFYISLSPDSEKEADQLFSGLSAGGQVMMPMGKTFWGSYFGMLKDQFAVQWMISFDYNQQ